jgi:SagB-type dehydrogenase family enzyme
LTTTGDVSRSFHEATKHTVQSIQHGGRQLDWDNKPHPFKVYERDLPMVAPPAALERVLRYGAGVLRKREYGGETLYFRTYASAGALYPVEVYVVIEPGVYHFDPLGKMLRTLRADDGATGRTLLVLAGIPWRTCWKYGERGYRHLWWDAGTILANVLALSPDALLAVGFDDARVARLVDVDGVREFPLCVVALDGEDADLDVDVRALGLRTRRLSPREERFPGVERVQAAGTLVTDELAAWRRNDETHGGTAEIWDEAVRVIRRRGSARRFGGAPIPASDLYEILRRALVGVPTDYAPSGSRMIRPYLAVHNVDGIEPGRYVWEGDELVLLRAGDVRREAAYLCLGQPLGGEGAATVFLTAELDDVLGWLGDRGYRAAQLEGGVTLGRIDLASHSLGWGATGLTFFDDDVTTFFSPHAVGRACMLACAIGERRGRLLPLA